MEKLYCSCKERNSLPLRPKYLVSEVCWGLHACEASQIPYHTHMESDNHPKKIQVFYDGQCPMCTVVMNKVDRSSKKEVFELHDMHRENRLPFEKSAVEKEIHVVDQDETTYKGAEAILKIMDQYPSLRVLAKIGRLPFVKPLLPIGYKIVSQNRCFLFGPASRIFWLRVAVTVAFTSGLIMSANLWLSSRSYPFAPVVDWLPIIAHPLDWILFGAFLIFAAAVLISSKPSKFILGALTIIFFLCLFDQTRWQPWVYQYSFLLITLALFSWKSDDVIGRTRALNIARLIVASTYIFSGLQKINPEFFTGVFPWLVEPITTILPSFAGSLYAFGIAAPFIQVVFGVGLLTRKFRRPSIVLAVLMHVFILAMIGPFGLNWNSIVWPWTAAMVIFDLLLFTGKEDFSFRDVLWSKNNLYHPVVLILFGILPFFSFVNLWDSYLSSALYSGNVTGSVIHLNGVGRSDLPPQIQKYVTSVSANDNSLNIQSWAIGNLNVPPYPETRVYKALAKKVCSYMTDSSQVVVIIQEQRMFRNNSLTTYRCWNL